MADYLALSLPSSPPALNPRLSPEIYLKRPAHSDEWRLDIMLKKKAVRRVVSLEGRCGGVVCGRRLVRRDYRMGYRKESEASGEETCPSCLLMSSKHHLLLFPTEK